MNSTTARIFIKATPIQANRAKAKAAPQVPAKHTFLINFSILKIYIEILIYDIEGEKRERDYIL